jgi:membrane protein involved in colicin uptake
MCKDGTSPGTYAPKPGSANAGESADGAAEAKASAAAEKARIAKEKADAKAAAAAEAKAAKEKAAACKTATSKYNSLANSATWKKIQSQMLGDSADDCSDSWDEKYAPKIAACKTDACRNGYQTTLNKKYSACEVRELWALDWETKVTTAEDAKNAACN